MKIGLVRRGYSPTGGAERYLLRFAEALREAGHDAILFTSPDWPREAWQGDLIRIHGASPRSFADALQKSSPRNHCDLLFSLERVWECDAYRAGDGLHMAWLERRRPFEPSWKSWFRATQPKHREILELERALFNPAANRLIIANSKMVAHEIQHHFQIPDSRIQVIYNGLPPLSFSLQPSTFPPSPISPSSFNLHPSTFLFAGSGWERKGLRFAIQAVNRIPGATLLVAGAGKRQKLPASSQTQFLGAIKDLPALMASATAFILPTLYDPFSNASLEAMAAGLPVITTTANGFAEIMRPGLDGEALPNPADIDSLAAALDAWRTRDTLSTRDARRDYARRFTIEQNVKETLAALEKFRI